MSAIYQKFVHKWLRVPYTLNVTEFRSVQRPRATIVLLHGIGNSAKAWEELVPMLPADVRVIGIDLLGFGASPKPTWATYDANQQARAVGATLLKLGFTQRVILVGHSLGALVSVAVAKRYPVAVQQMILCSPPFYKPKKNGSVAYDDALTQMYKIAKKNPGQLMTVLELAKRAGISSPALQVDDTNIGAYVAALESSIINQSSLRDIQRIRIPTRILYGAFDPVVIPANITALTKKYGHITSRKLMVAHEIKGRYTKALAAEIKNLL